MPPTRRFPRDPQPSNRRVDTVQAMMVAARVGGRGPGVLPGWRGVPLAECRSAGLHGNADRASPKECAPPEPIPCPMMYRQVFWQQGKG